MSIYTARPLPAWPHIEIFEADGTSAPKPINLDPPVISSPFTMGYSSNLSQLALAYNMRPGESEGIGNPDDNPPTEGLRVFSHDDTYLLIGGSSTQSPVLYRRSGPTYIRTPLTLALPAAPNHYTFAVFSPVEDRLAVVESSNPYRVYIYVMVDGHFEVASTFDMPYPVSDLFFTAGGSYIIAITGFDRLIWDVQAASPVGGMPSGKLMTASEDETKFLFAPVTSGDPYRVHTYDGTDWLGYKELPDSYGDNSRGWFTTGDRALVLAVERGSDSYLKQYALVEDTYYHKTRDDDTGAIGDIADDFKLSRSGLNAMSKIGSSVTLYEEGVLTLSPIVPTGVPVPSGTNDGRWIKSAGDRFFVAEQYGFKYYDLVDGALVYSGQFFLPPPAPQIYDFAAVSSDGVYVYLATTSGSAIRLVKWNGSAYTLVAGPVSAGGNCTDLTCSGDGVYMCRTARTGTTEYVRIYKRSGDTFAALPALSSQTPFGALSCSMSASGATLAVVHLTDTSRSIRVWSRSGDTFTVVLNQGGTGLNNARVSADGTRLAVGRSTGVDLFLYNGSALTPAGTDSGIHEAAVTFSQDGSRIAVSGVVPGTSQADFRIYSADGGALVFIGSPRPHSAPRYAAFSSSHFFIMTADNSVGGSPTVASYLEGEPPVLTLYNPVLTEVVSSTAELWDFSPTGSLVHYGDGSLNFHRSVPSYAAVTALPFEPDEHADLVSDVLYSPTGNVVLWVNSEGLQLATQSNAGNYNKASNLNGTFVSVYVRSGDSLTEKGYITHEVGSQIFNMVFSATPLLFSYLSITPDGHPLRRIYDTGGGRLNLAWSFTRPDLLDNYLAFSPFESNFAMTFDWSELDSEIRLYSIDGGLNVLELDDKQVSFGPLAYSSCDDIVVAHGGLTNPFTHYKVVEDELVKQEYLADFEWGVTAPILHISFVGDCSQLVIITEEEIITVEKDEESEEGFNEQDYAPLKEPADKGSNAVVGAGGGVWSGGGVNGGGAGSGGGIGGNGGGGYAVGPGGSLNPLGTTPYVAINIAYRV